ncbi:MAG TPA: extracellular solute-binding protein [Acidimicrobiia bacterium]|jgi:multiple sugar transport system substrate-binding protein|nr:extracellular solute-binding protein [Acidimicrobiia bacterium]
MRRWKDIAAVVALMMLIAACGGGGGSSETTTGGGTDTTQGSTDTTQGATETTGGSGEKVTVRWFIGLGAGGQPEQEAAQRAVVDEFNASQDEIELVIEIVENDVAYETLATQIASGNAPDIIGPVGRDGSNEYAGLYLDIEPLIESTGVDTSMWEEAAIENQRESDGTLVGLPFASYPSVMYFNRDLFDEAGLPYPPQEYGPDGTAVYGEGTEYEGPWDYDKVAELAQILTVDANGVDATDPAFDRTNTVQWGFHWQWTTRVFQNGAYWGAGYPVADDGSADIPTAWEEEWTWWHDAIWNLGISPSQEQMDAIGDNVFQTGNLAMATTHLWYTCCISDEANDIVGDFWDFAVVPAHNGNVTANMHADTFRILASTKVPEEAFRTMYYLLTDAALPLLTAYGAAPADPALTDAFIASLEGRYPQGVNWQVALDGAAFADDPSHEAAVPGWGEYKVRLAELESAILSDPALDVATSIADVEEDLTLIFEQNAD